MPRVFTTKEMAFRSGLSPNQTAASFYNGSNGDVIREDYRYLIEDLPGLVRVIEKTIHYKPWYATGVVSGRFAADPAELDRRMIRRFQTDAPKWDTWRMKQAGLARYKYVRFGMRWWLFASAGDRSAMEERNAVHHVRDVPIKVDGYSISLKRGGYERRSREERTVANEQWQAYKQAKSAGTSAPKPSPPKQRERKVASVRLEHNAREGLEIEAVKLARKAKRHQVAAWFFAFEFTPYRPIYEQQKAILRKVNKILHARGMEQLPTSIIRWKRIDTPAYTATGGAVPASHAGDERDLGSESRVGEGNQSSGGK
ncbi:MAG: hypothetical protein CMJ58_25855 [Planctomycetaceae bacterium]|nr:hypothetical protein [Planctomycetaceae bacterium]